MKKSALAGFVVAILGLAGIVQAADKNDPTGTWKWKSKFGKNEFERTMKLQYKGGKLTGTVSGFGKMGTDTKIEDGMFKDGELSFTTTNERKGNKIISKYSGKLTDDNTITGTIMVDAGGKDFKQDWEAKRAGKRKD